MVCTTLLCSCLAKLDNLVRSDQPVDKTGFALFLSTDLCRNLFLFAQWASISH